MPRQSELRIACKNLTNYKRAYQKEPNDMNYQLCKLWQRVVERLQNEQA